MNTQKVKSTFRHGMAGSHTYSVAMSPDGRLLAVSSDGGNDVIAELILWHVESERIIMRFDRQAWIPSQVTFLRGGEYLAATAYDPGAHRNDGTFLWRLGTSADDGRKSSK